MQARSAAALDNRSITGMVFMPPRWIYSQVLDAVRNTAAAAFRRVRAAA
jgi:hypothetical protein